MTAHLYGGSHFGIWNWLWLVVGLAALSPAFLSLWYILTYGVNAAHWDHLANAELFERFYNGSLTIEYLTRPHLEHIKIFPRLVALGLGLLTSFNNVAEMFVQWLLLCACAAILFDTLRRTLVLPVTTLVASYPPVTLALFNLRQHESMLTGDGMITYLSIAAVTAALCLLHRAATRNDVAAAAIAGIVASFSHASALLVWPIGALLLIAKGGAALARRPAMLWWLGGAAVAITVYAVRWPTASGGAIGYAAANPGATLQYIAAVSGVPFTANAAWQMPAGVVALTLELCVLGLVLSAARGSRRVPLGVWLCLFALGCRVLMAAGRLHGLGGEALPSRYAAFVMVGTVGVYVAALAVRRSNARGRVAFAVATLLALSSMLGYRDGLRAGPGERDTRLLIGQLLATTELQTDEMLERWVYPYAPHARVYAEVLRTRALNVFAGPRIEPRDLALTSGVRYSFDWINGMHVPAGASFEVSRSDLLQISGWAFSDAAAAALAGVYIQFGEVIIPAAYGIHRPDVPGVHPGAPDDSGFRATIAAVAVAGVKVPIRFHFVLADRERVFTTGVLAVIDVRE